MTLFLIISAIRRLFNELITSKSDCLIDVSYIKKNESSLFLYRCTEWSAY